jgi:hypothetical protein
MSDINKELAGLLGLCWHDCYSCKAPLTDLCDKMNEGCPLNPDFTTDPGKIELLRLMLKRPASDFDAFIVENGSLSKYGRHLDCILVDLVTDTTGLLAQAAVEWLRKGAGDEPR